MSWIGAVESWDPRADITPIEVRQLGSEDVYKLLKGQEAYSIALEYFLQHSTFAKYGVNPQGGGAGSIDKSLSLAAGLKMGGAAGTTYYYKMQGSRPRTITISGRPGEAHRVRYEIIAQLIPIPSTPNPVGTGSWASDPGTAPWIFTSGGANPVTVGGEAVPCVEISASIERNTESLYVMGQSTVAYLPPKQRAVTATMTLVWLAQSRYTDLQNFTDRNVVWTLNSSPSSVLTLSNCKFHRLDSFTVRPTEVLLERWAITGLSAALT